MKLKVYLELPGNSATKLAEATGASISAITRAANGITIPNRELMTRIAEETGGQVTPNDFFDIGAKSVPTDAHAPDPVPEAEAGTEAA